MNQPSAPLSPSSRAARPVRRARGWRLRPQALALALVASGVAPSLLPPGTAQALAQSLPSGLQVVHGQASVSTLGN
ncbi:MAG: hypothetical protein KGL50_06525, partial [Burkholderiales bacterium]|nr:hypothetical protein [Burkholderiales bacterium]